MMNNVAYKLLGGNPFQQLWICSSHVIVKRVQQRQAGPDFTLRVDALQKVILNVLARLNASPPPECVETSELKLPIIIDTPLSRLDSSHRDSIVSNYFPNAGEQVLILSTDTEIDKNHYKTLKPRLSGAASLEYDKLKEMTVYREGYFWEK